MGKLSKIISLFLATILIFTGCTQKYDIVDHNDYSSALWDDNSSYGDDTLLSGGDFAFSDSSVILSGSSDILSDSSGSIDGNTATTGTTTATINTGTTKPLTTTTKPVVTTNPVTTVTPSGGNNSYTPVYYSNMKAIWLSYYNFYYDIKYKNATTFRTYAKDIMQRVKNFGFNTVIVHLRSHGDAIYDSAYFPWSNIVGGKSPGYDPTQILIEEAHKQGLSFHAWFNPLRLATPTVVAGLNNKYQIKQWYNTKYGDYVIKSGNYCYLNPAYTDVRNLIINGAKEIAQKYDVDALHIDDYFYPTNIDSSFDSKAYASLGGGKTLANFRRSNINTLIKGIYNAVKGVNSKLKFGISPGGNIDRNYNELYADTTLWLQNSGYMDYCIPQIYWGYKHSTHDFKKITTQWKNLATNNNVALVIGLAYYKVSNNEYKTDGGSNEWVSDYTIISRQVKDTKTILGSKYKGFAIFDYDYLFETPSGILDTTFHNNAKNELKKVM